MPLYRVTIADKTGKIQTKEIYAGNICGAKQITLVQLGLIHPKVSHRYQDNPVIFRSIVEIDSPGS